jgi:hypothetical protein
MAEIRKKFAERPWAEEKDRATAARLEKLRKEGRIP